MKKILFVVDENKMGGVCYVLEDILRKINKENRQIDVLVLHNNGDCLKNLGKDINIIYGTKFFESIDITKEDIIESKSINKIFHKIYLMLLIKTGFIKYKILKERKKIISKNYDVEVAFKYGFTTFFTYYGNSKKKINWIHCDCINLDPCIKYRKKVSKIMEEYDLNVALSENLKKSILSVYPNIEDNIVTINNLFDEEKIRNSIQNIKYVKSNTLRFVMLGRLSKVKGYDKIIEVVKLLKNDNLQKKFKFVFIGDGEEKENLISKVLEYKIDDCVTFLGKKNPPYPYMKNNDCFILSSNSEAFPLVIIEAFYCGLPVISTNIVSAYEMIEDGKNGIIVNNSIEDLYKIIKKVILNDKIIFDMRNNLKNYAYNNTIILKQIDEILL